jgi:hypothetical protein
MSSYPLYYTQYNVDYSPKGWKEHATKNILNI